MEDPWDWDVERVIQEICVSKRSQSPSSAPLKLPPVDQLERALRENEVDGEVLLTYDQTELCTELGVKILKHKSIFKKLVHDLQLRSNRYRAYRKRQASEFEFEDDRDPVIDKVEQYDKVQNTNESRASILDSHLSGPGDTPRPQGVVTQQNDPSTTANENEVKKRRLAPILMTTEIDPNRNRALATEADTVCLPSRFDAESAEEPSVGSTLGHSYAGAYLGDKSITRFDIIDFDLGFHGGYSEAPSREDKELNIALPTPLFPGRLVQAHRLMKRRLLRKTAPRRTRLKKSDIVPGSTNPDHDELLPIYGDSDDDMEYDSDTWKEIEAEREERESKQALPKGLSVDEIESTFNRVMEQFASEWIAIKLPKYTNTAHLVWSEGRKYGLKRAIDTARRDLSGFETRIAKWKETILKNEYRNVQELEQSLSSFEPSVFDREHRSWLIRVFTSPTQPTKPSRPRHPAPRPHKLPATTVEDEEILTSDSDSDMRSFIVDDEPDAPIVADDGYLSDAGEGGHFEPKEDPDSDVAMGNNDDPGEVGAKLPGEDVAPHTENLRTPMKPLSFIDLTHTPDHAPRMINDEDGESRSREASNQVIGRAAGPLIMPIDDMVTAEKKVAKTMVEIDQQFINFIFSIARQIKPRNIWSDFILPALEREWPKAPYNNHTRREGLAGYQLVRLFEIHKDSISYRLGRYKNLNEEGKQRVRELYGRFPDNWDEFVRFLRRLSDRFEWIEERIVAKKHRVPATSLRDPKEEALNPDSPSADTDAISDMDVDTGVGSPTGGPNSEQKKRRKRRKKKTRKVVRNYEAAMDRELDQAGAAERENRRKKLRERLVLEGSTALGSHHGSIIVNESKSDDQEFIYIHNKIASRIKEHQITGVRFMWDQLVVAKKRQGCLLAHTMGLGKTMQVITLLVTIGQASVSEEPTVSSQIPKEMRSSRTLILCPATLVNNWLDEMQSWLPENHGLGDVVKVDATLSLEKRSYTLRTWGEVGGIMIIGYHLFKTFFNDENASKILLERPNIVIADEAHMMKNPKSKTHVAAANFRTLSRVALTGSPLANNVEEYFSMIDWVAPNYLGDIREFRGQYANPINQGLHADSTASERRHAFRMLRVLKSEVSPKVSRITIAVLKHDIPMKKEFVITVPLTHIQRQAYEMFIQYHSTADPNSTNVPVFAIHDLSLICASPSIFLAKLRKLAKPERQISDKSENVTLPPQLISDEMALLCNAERAEKDDFALSWKVPILLEILAQCKRLGEYVLLFSHSMVTLDYLEGMLRIKKFSFVRLDGKTQMTDRQGLVRQFNNGKIDIFLISTRAGALGLNITGANRVIIFDAQFNPQNEQQAVGRAYRIGQKKPVFVYRFVCGGTCEQKLLHQAIWKMQLASRVVDKKHPIHKVKKSAGPWVMPEEPQQKDLDPMVGKDTVLDVLLSKTQFREGIRAIEMMDTFEEEAVESAELSAEDVAYADQLILQNEARRAGLAQDNFVGPNFVSLSQPPPQPSPILPPLRVSQPLPQSLPTGPLSAGQPPQQIPPAMKTTWANGVPPSLAGPDATPTQFLPPVSPGDPHGLRPPPSLPPMQLKGAEVHIRPSGDYHNRTSGGDWGSLSVIQDDLKRAFAINAGFPDKGTRSRAGMEVASAIWDHIQHKSHEQRLAAKLAILPAVSAERFVEAICIGHISPPSLSQMTPEDIDQQLKSLKEIDELEWDAKKVSWKSQGRSSDPEVGTPTQKRQQDTSH